MRKAGAFAPAFPLTPIPPFFPIVPLPTRYRIWFGEPITFDGDPEVLDALRAGASGYVLKRNPDQLAAAIRHVHAGEVWLDPAVAGHVLAALAAQPRPGLPVALVGLLTPREREVLALLAEGLSNTEMAARLFVGVGTVKTHMSRILFKTGCRDRAQATALAFTSGLVSTG